jgi:hypothetical protein
MKSHYCDSEHPIVKRLAIDLSKAGETDFNRFERIFDYVRNHILFGFPPVWDHVKASESIRYGLGYCNTKSILIVALCRAVGIPAKLHFGLINMKIMNHIFPKWVFGFLPASASHSWVEVQLDHTWYPVDAHILDEKFLAGAQYLLQKDQVDIGYGIAKPLMPIFSDWRSGFVQTNAVMTDQGVWDDAAAYYESNRYSRLKSWQLATFPILKMIANRNIKNIRNQQIDVLTTTREEVSVH